MKVAAILPAYNEADRVARVLAAVRGCARIDEVIVVDDGSTDDTAAVASAVDGVRLVKLEQNRGKGGAMVVGAASTDADVLVFIDADLQGLSSTHVDILVAPVADGRVNMTIGKFRGGRRLTDWSQRIAPNISGQRAITREVFELIPDLAVARFGVEMAITRYCRYHRVSCETVFLNGVTHPMKEEKLGLLKGWASRGRMYYQILRIMLHRRAPRKPGHGTARHGARHHEGRTSRRGAHRPRKGD